MFIGHFAVGFASKRLAPRTSLATLIAAALFLDMLFPAFLLTGVEHARITPRIGGAVFSHFVLDWITHRPDMQLYPGSSTRVGLGLWYSLGGTLAIEGAMFAAGVAIYATCTRARDRQGSIGFWLYVAILLAAYLGSMLGPPPPSVTAVAVSGLIVNLLFFWILWFDRHRERAPN